MAKNTAPAAHTEDTPPAMDYAMHNATYRGFISFTKWTIAVMVVVVVALYCFIVGNQPLIGALLLLLGLLGAGGGVVMGARRT